MHNFERFAWLTFDSEQTMNIALQELDGKEVKVPEVFASNEELTNYTLNPVKSTQPHKQPKVTPPLPEGYVKEYLSLCRKLIHDIFDVEAVLEFPFQRLEAELPVDKQRLDFLVLYLRKVHGYCLFCGINCRDERSLAVKCSVSHLRNSRAVPRKEFDNSSEHYENKQFH
jgi:hypothetical protein